MKPSFDAPGKDELQECRGRGVTSSTIQPSHHAGLRSTVSGGRTGTDHSNQQHPYLNNSYHNKTNNDNHHNEDDGEVGYTLNLVRSKSCGGGGESTVGSSLGADSSYRQDAKWRRRTRRLLERSAEQQHEQARRAGHVAVEHFWNLALKSSPASPCREMWYPTLLSDIASVESVLGDDNSHGGVGAGGVGHSDGEYGGAGGGEDDDHSHKSFLSRSKRALKRYSICSSSFSRSDDVESLIGNGIGDSSVRAMKRGVRRGKREHNESKNPAYRYNHYHRSRYLSHGSSTIHDGETSSSYSSSNTQSNGGAAAAWRKHRRLLWFGGSGGNRYTAHPKKRKKKTGCSPFLLGDLQAYLGPMDDADADAWMCGVCGRAFATLEAADKHEQDHIQQVVNTLPWMTKPKSETNSTEGVVPQEPLTTADDGGEEEEETSARASQSIHRLVSRRVSRQDTRVMSNLALSQQEEEDESHIFLEQEKAPQRRKVSYQNELLSHNNEPIETVDVRSVPSDLLDEILQGEDHAQPQQQRGPFFGSLPAGELGLSDALIEDVLEEEKEEIEFTGETEPVYVPLRADAILYEDGGIGYLSPQPITATLEENDLDGNGTSPSAPRPRESWPGNEFLLEQDALIPRMRSEAQLYQGLDGEEQNHSSVPYRIDQVSNEQSMQYTDEPKDSLLLSSAVRDYVILADEALINVCEKARRLILNEEEVNAERQLSLLARDKLYYDNLAKRSHYHKNPNHRHRHEGQGLIGKMQNKFLDAYQLMKEGTDNKGFRDEYNARSKKSSNVQGQKLVVHNQKTMYLNVMVKNGIQVVKNELERLAQERWEKGEEIDKYTRFERFRMYAHVNLVRLAGLALSSDFTPRRIAVQLSNDIYRLLTPRLKRRGVLIETEIEYRVGPYFVLAVNVLHIDWRQLLKATHRFVRLRQEKWEQKREEEKLHQAQQEQELQEEGGEQLQQPPPKEPSVLVQWKDYLMHVFQLTRHDLVAQIFAWLYQNTSWIFYQPLCILCYYTFFGSLIRHFILSSVSDEIFYYVEERGLEMEIGVRHASVQAAFMLSALREIRADSKDHKQKQQQGKEGGKENVLGPLLGPAIQADNDVVEPPPGFEVPEHLEYLGLELDVPVGFRRLRWAFLSDESSFLTEALYRIEAKYENITMGTWNRHHLYIGSTKKLPEGVDEKDFIGAEKHGSYLMPKSAFVKANMCSETHFIVAYNDYCFTLKKRALTPDVPYGSTFVAWTQFTVINTGHHSCRLQFSVEPEFPNGPPMVSRQIKSGMRAGVGQLFVLIHETIAKYADEYP